MILINKNMKTNLFNIITTFAVLLYGLNAWAQCPAPTGYTSVAINGNCWLNKNTQAPNGDSLWTKMQITNVSGNPCPDGWRLPTLQEFSDAASALNITASNEHPVFFWTADNISTGSGTETNYQIIYFENCDYSMLYGGNDDDAYAVRCVKSGFPVVATLSVDPVLNYSAICQSKLTDEGTPAATVRGVCWGTNATPTTTASNTTVTNDGTGLGEYSTTMASLTPGTTYYVRAYATNDMGTAYGDILEFTPENPCGSATTVSDHQGNTYGVVAVGTQCWTKQNMKCTTLPSGATLTSTSEATYLPYYTTTTGTVNDWSYTEYYYNWAAAMAITGLSENTPYDYSTEGVRGICPEGWHLPTAADWDVMNNYLNNIPMLVCGSEAYNVAKNIAATSGWLSYKAYECQPGYNQSENNSTDFTAYPAGWFNAFTNSFQHQGANAYFWTSTQGNNTTADTRSLSFDFPAIGGDLYMKNFALSVRCLKNSSSH